MPTVTEAFNTYKVWYNTPIGSPYAAYIYVYDGTTYKGRMVFYPEGAVVPANLMFNPFGGTPRPSLHYPLSRFNDVITLVREEQPLHSFLNTDNGIGFVATSDFEPVGEEEAC